MKAESIVWRDLTPLIAPRSVAIVGASGRTDGNVAREPRGNRAIRNLKNFGYEGRIVTVNPKYNEILGFPCYPDVASIPEPVDCLVSAVPNRHVADLLEASANAGIKAAVVFAAGFGEIGGEGKERQARLEALSKDKEFLICGPNCYGVLNVYGKALLFASTIPPGFLTGNVALISQSGGLSTTIGNALMLNRHVGLSHIISCGNQAGASVEEYINYFAEDEKTQVIAVFAEGFKQPEKLLPAARKAAERNKPVIILKGGRSDVGKRAAANHSGSIAGTAEIIDAAFRQGGIIGVRSLNELLDTVSLFSCERFMKKYRGGRRMGVLSGSGGECTLVSDAASRVGVEVPALTEATKSKLQASVADFGNMNNPLDGTGAMYDDDKIFPALLQGLIDDANIDVVTVNLEANDPRPKELKSGGRFAKIVEQTAAASPKPIATFSSIVGGPVDPDILQPLRQAGVPIMEGAECATASLRNLADYFQFQQQRRSQAITVPAHTKLASGKMTNDEALRLLGSCGLRTAPLEKPSGLEMILSIKREPLLGPVLWLHFGGILANLLGECAAGIPPLSLTEARDMVQTLRGMSATTIDVEALSDAVAKVSQLAASLGDQLRSLEINPLIVLPKGQGVVAVDATVEIS